MHLCMSTSYLSMWWHLLCLTLCYPKALSSSREHSDIHTEIWKTVTCSLCGGGGVGVKDLEYQVFGSITLGHSSIHLLFLPELLNIRKSNNKSVQSRTPPPPMGPPSVKKQVLFTQKLLLNCLTIEFLSLFLLWKVISNLICCNFLVTLK